MASEHVTAGTDEGESFGKYRLLKLIGMGGMAEVYLAEQAGAAGFQKRLVIKRVLAHFQHDDRLVEMFLDEARLVARMSHPNIAQTFDLGQTEGSYFIAMEYIAGQTIWSLIRRLAEMGAHLPLGAGLRVVSQLLEALNYAHALADDSGQPLNIVHRDVTPSNVMVTQQGGVKLLDFGIARAEQRRHVTAVGVTKGSAGFMAPEQARIAPLDRRTDIFAAGAILYLLVTGRAPYAGSDERSIFHDMMLARFPRPAAVAPATDLELERIILKAMALDPNERYSTAFDMLQDLELFARHRSLWVGPRELAALIQFAFPELSVQAEASPERPPPGQGLGELALPPTDLTPTHQHQPAATLHVDQQPALPELSLQAEASPGKPPPGEGLGELALPPTDLTPTHQHRAVAALHLDQQPTLKVPQVAVSPQPGLAPPRPEFADGLVGSVGGFAAGPATVLRPARTGKGAVIGASLATLAIAGSLTWLALSAFSAPTVAQGPAMAAPPQPAPPTEPATATPPALPEPTVSAPAEPPREPRTAIAPAAPEPPREPRTVSAPAAPEPPREPRTAIAPAAPEPPREPRTAIAPAAPEPIRTTRTEPPREPRTASALASTESPREPRTAIAPAPPEPIVTAPAGPQKEPPPVQRPAPPPPKGALARRGSAPAGAPALAPAATPAPASGAPGILAISSEPAARILVKGHDHGLSPQRVELPAGMHRVVLVYPGGAKRTLLLIVESGRETAVTAHPEQ